MLRFYGQPKFNLDKTDKEPVGYELFIREQRGENWVLPDDFTASTPEQIADLLMRTIAMLPEHVQLVSFNLEQCQFIDPAFTKAIAKVQATTNVEIFTELTERTDPNVTNDQLYAAAQRFHAAHLLVCMDDVGTGDNTPELVVALDDFIDEYKFALQNFRPFNHISEIKETIDYWYDMAEKHHKMLAIEGIETAEDLATIQEDYPCNLIQGYYTGRPFLMPISSVTAAS
ncbi:EAL domain-containing protein [Lacticaseibacillus zhaodongensis]|uniref:EAL domain-containing protein n=1 Tax=Lacticaseibacillus zhaodongensis TaxID=2668065 RepID=UPI0012D2A77C|nr:EAL domain-containing protein [Lacticaseibacillus zhaodongensis]